MVLIVSIDQITHRLYFPFAASNSSAVHHAGKLKIVNKGKTRNKEKTIMAKNMILAFSMLRYLNNLVPGAGDNAFRILMEWIFAKYIKNQMQNMFWESRNDCGRFKKTPFGKRKMAAESLPGKWHLRWQMGLVVLLIGGF